MTTDIDVPLNIRKLLSDLELLKTQAWVSNAKGKIIIYGVPQSDFSVDNAIEVITEYKSLKAHNLALVGALKELYAAAKVLDDAYGGDCTVEIVKAFENTYTVLSNPDIQKYSRLLDAVEQWFKAQTKTIPEGGTVPDFKALNESRQILSEAYQALQEKVDG